MNDLLLNAPTSKDQVSLHLLSRYFGAGETGGGGPTDRTATERANTISGREMPR